MGPGPAHDHRQHPALRFFRDLYLPDGWQPRAVAAQDRRAVLLHDRGLRRRPCGAVVLALERSQAATVLNGLAHRVLDHGLDLTPGEAYEVADLTLLVEEIRLSGMVFFEGHHYDDEPP